MPKKQSYLTVTDQFCGCGGSSSGAKKVLDKIGGELKLALNHWKLAIETHSTNFPNTSHDCTDVSACDPRRYPSTDILITSPECTTHSPAGGNNHKALKKQMDLFENGTIDPSTERSRATMWDVCRFAEYHDYNLIIVENVVEAKTRWPLFDVWLMAMHKLGYDHRCVYLNSMHCHPTPQSRDRMYVVFWKKGNKAPNLDFTPLAFCIKCDKNIQSVQTWKRSDKQYGKYRQQYVYCCPSCTAVVEPYYYAVFNCIDWSDLGKRIGDRSKPLKENTVKRINYGLDKYGMQPLVVVNYSPGYSRPATDQLGTITCNDSHAIFNPFIVNTCNQSHSEAHLRSRSKSVAEHGFTQTTYNGQMIINHPFVIRVEQGSQFESARSVSDVNQTQLCWQTAAIVSPPFIVNDQHSTGLGFRVKGLEDFIPTVPTTHQMKLVTPPFLLEMSNHGKARLTEEEVNTVTAGGIKTGLVTNDAWNSFISCYNNGSHVTKHFMEELPTQATGERLSLTTYQKPNIDDCYYRMLKHPEIQLAMAFESSYVVLGTVKEKVKQLGNAVTPPAMENLIQRGVESLN